MGFLIDYLRLRKARRIVYGSVRKFAPEATLDDDRLNGEEYEGYWSNRGKVYYVTCANVFADDSYTNIFVVEE